jgi:hypothetical protein
VNDWQRGGTQRATKRPERAAEPGRTGGGAGGATSRTGGQTLCAAPTANPKDILPPGVPVGWCGYPNIADQQNCFFAGHLSSPVDASGDYLVDGVVIHGVSGAPAFISVEDHVTLIGVISAYLPNRTAGEVLPGMSLIRSVNPFTEYFAQANGKAKKRAVKRQAKTHENRGAE